MMGDAHGRGLALMRRMKVPLAQRDLTCLCHHKLSENSLKVEVSSSREQWEAGQEGQCSQMPLRISGSGVGPALTSLVT